MRWRKTDAQGKELASAVVTSGSVIRDVLTITRQGLGSQGYTRVSTKDGVETWRRRSSATSSETFTVDAKTQRPLSFVSVEPGVRMAFRFSVAEVVEG